MFVRPTRVDIIRHSVTRAARKAILAGLATVLVTTSPLVISSAMAQGAALPLRDGVPSLAPIVDKVTPAVVNIAVKSKADAPDLSGIPRDFRRFFQMPDDGSGTPQQPRQQTQTSLGSGFIIDAKKGYILTNHHVIDKATEVIVTLKDRRELTAKVIGSDEGTDVALLQVEARDLTALPFGDSTSLKVGDFVLAVGDPFGLGQSVTYGVVSGLGRSQLNIEGFEDFIQTDAAINPGNSGGPLVNLKGEVVGMNTAIFAPAGGNIGVGFAVPSAMANAVVAQLIQNGSVKRGLIGVEIGDLSPALAKNLGVDVSEGALVRRVTKGSPAETAGVKAGDVVTALNGKALHSSSDLRNRLGLMPVGTTVELTINREGKAITTKVTIAKTPREAETKVADRAELEGANFETVEAGSKVKGVRVTDVARGSTAWQLGLRARDVIVAINRQPISDFNELLDALKESSHATVLAVKRGDEDVRIVLP